MCHLVYAPISNQPSRRLYPGKQEVPDSLERTCSYLGPEVTRGMGLSLLAPWLRLTSPVRATKLQLISTAWFSFHIAAWHGLRRSYEPVPLQSSDPCCFSFFCSLALRRAHARY